MPGLVELEGDGRAGGRTEPALGDRGELGLQGAEEDLGVVARAQVLARQDLEDAMAERAEGGAVEPRGPRPCTPAAGARCPRGRAGGPAATCGSRSPERSRGEHGRESGPALPAGSRRARDRDARAPRSSAGRERRSQRQRPAAGGGWATSGPRRSLPRRHPGGAPRALEDLGEVQVPRQAIVVRRQVEVPAERGGKEGVEARRGRDEALEGRGRHEARSRVHHELEPAERLDRRRGAEGAGRNARVLGRLEEVSGGPRPRSRS